MFVVSRRVCGELLSKGRQRAVTWRITTRGSVPGLGDSRSVACLGVVTLTEQLEIDGVKFHGFSCVTNNWWS
jgi:hypothetical protein